MRPPKPFEFHKPGTWPLAGINSPRAMSWYANVLNDRTFRKVAKQSPRAAAALLTQLMLENEPDSTRAGGD